MINVTGRVCLNHPDRAAVSRCETCFRPLCPECIRSTDGVHFCSETCARNYARSGERMADFNAKARRGRFRRRVRRVLTLAVLAVLAYFAYRWYTVHRKETSDLLDRARRTAGEVRKSVDTGIRGDK